MMDDDYEIISHNEVERLKKGLDTAKSSGSYDLKKSIEHLTEKLDNMIDVFEAASDDLREEDQESELVTQKIDPIIEKLKEIDEQNKKLADGIVAINAIKFFNRSEEHTSELQSRLHLLCRLLL